MDGVSVLLVGINGYASGYLRLMLNQAQEHGAYIAGIVDPTAANSDEYENICQREIPVYCSMDEFYSEHSADLAVISTPIQLHCQQVITALANKSNVLCEKPLCATVDEIELMSNADNPGNKFAAIGFNWSFSSTIQDIKKDILSGMYGAPKRLRSMVFWPRNKAYYQRSNWAGKQKNDRGDWILDSPLSNATSHFLHNMLYVCGEDTAAADMPERVTAELYRANPIGNFDTAAVRVITQSGVEICFYTTHAVDTTIDPLSSYEFENGIITHNMELTEFSGKLKDGAIKKYPIDPNLNTHVNKLWQCIDLCRNGGEPVCNIATASALTKVVNSAQLSSPQIKVIPEQMITRDNPGEDNELTHINGIKEALIQSYANWQLPSESGMYDWAQAGKTIDAASLTHFEL